MQKQDYHINCMILQNPGTMDIDMIQDGTFQPEATLLSCLFDIHSLLPYISFTVSSLCSTCPVFDSWGPRQVAVALEGAPGEASHPPRGWELSCHRWRGGRPFSASWARRCAISQTENATWNANKENIQIFEQTHIKTHIEYCLNMYLF